MRTINAIMGALVMLSASACASSSRAVAPDEDCREDTAEDIGNSAQVAGQGIEAGAETGWAGVKQAGRATGGLIAGGTEEANEEWQKGKAETNQEADEGNQEIAMAKKKKCPNRR